MKTEKLLESIEKKQQELADLLNQRNALIKVRFEEQFNVNTWNKIRLGYVYEVLGKEFKLKPVTIIKVLKTK